MNLKYLVLLIPKKSKKIIIKKKLEKKSVKNGFSKYKKTIYFKNIKIKFFKNDVFFFLKKLFNSFIKKGKKYRIINYFLKVFFFASLKIFRKKNIKKKKYTFLYFYKILYNVVPVFIYTNFMFRGENKILPWARKNKRTNRIKLLKIAANWVKRAILKRKEKTLFFKIISELEDLRKNKGESVKSKNDYYTDFYNNKYFIKFLRKRIWT